METKGQGLVGYTHTQHSKLENINPYLSHLGHGTVVNNYNHKSYQWLNRIWYTPYFLCHRNPRPVTPRKNNTPANTVFHDWLDWSISAKLCLKLMRYTVNVAHKDHQLIKPIFCTSLLTLKRTKSTMKPIGLDQWSLTCKLLLVGECCPGTLLLLLQGLLLRAQVLHIADRWQRVSPIVEVGRQGILVYLCDSCMGSIPKDSASANLLQNNDGLSFKQMCID